MEDLLTILTLLGMFAISIGTVASAFWFGLKGGHESVVGNAEESAAVAVWTARADKLSASQPGVAESAAEEAAEADDEAIKARKRDEALARKAARQAKQAASS